MKIRLCALVLLALAGCQSVGELRTKAPYQTFIGTKSVDAITACITDAWENHKILWGSLDVRVNPTAGGKTVLVFNSAINAPFVFADVLGDNGQTIVKYYANPDHGPAVNSIPKLIPPCL